MLRNAKKIAIRFLTPLSWRSEKRLARSMRTFAAVESDSAWQMLQALGAIDQREYQTKLFNNALEEMYHADLFLTLAAKYSESWEVVHTDDRRCVYDSTSGLARFEAYHFVGEQSVYDTFLSYAAAAPSHQIRRVFLRIRRDECRHKDQAYAHLVNLVNSRFAVRRLIVGVHVRRTLESLRRFRKASVDLLASALLGVVYYTFVPFFAYYCRRRLNTVQLLDGVEGPAGANSTG